MLRYFLALLLVFPFGCDFLVSEENAPEYVGMWLSETTQGDLYIHFTEETLRQYLTSSQDTTCLSRAWKIQDYDPEANVMFFRSSVNSVNEWHVEVRGDTMTAGALDNADFHLTYHRTDEDPRVRSECRQTEEALRSHLYEKLHREK